MNRKKITKENGFAQVPNGIVDAAVPDTLKLLLWYCYAKPADWTFSVADVRRSLNKSPQCIRDYFRQFVSAKMFNSAGLKQNKHGKYPVFTFDPAYVDTVVTSNLKIIPESDPESDVETDHETKVETDPETKGETGRSHSNTDATNTDATKNNLTKGIDGTSSENLSGKSQDAEGGGVAGVPSKSARSVPDTIQHAAGSSNDDGMIEKDATPTLSAASIIQCSAGGNANTTATNSSTGHPVVSANSASGTVANSGGPRGDLPKGVAEQSKWLVANWKKHARFTEASIEIMAGEMWKQLNEYKGWDLAAEFGIPPLQFVKSTSEEVQKRFGVYR